MVKKLTKKELAAFKKRMEKYRDVKYVDAKKRFEERVETGKERADVFLICPVPGDPRYGKEVQPIPVYDSNGIITGFEFEYV